MLQYSTLNCQLCVLSFLFNCHLFVSLLVCLSVCLLCAGEVAADLVVAAVLVQQRDDGFNVGFLDNVQGLWTFYQNAVENLQNPCRERGVDKRQKLLIHADDAT